MDSQSHWYDKGIERGRPHLRVGERGQGLGGGWQESQDTQVRPLPIIFSDLGDLSLSHSFPEMPLSMTWSGTILASQGGVGAVLGHTVLETLGFVPSRAGRGQLEGLLGCHCPEMVSTEP